MQLRKIRSSDHKDIILFEESGNWFSLTEQVGQDVNINTGSMIEVLANWPLIKGMITESARCKPHDGTSQDSALLPINPKSFRDFMLYEKHAINAARGFLRTFLPSKVWIMKLYETLTGSTFPMLKPSKLWYRQPIYYMANHLNFQGSGSKVDIPDYTQYFDYELELGIVLCRPLKDATKQEAHNAIGGFVVLNDFSARDVQLAEMKSGFGPQKAKHFVNTMSNVIVPASDIIDDIENLKASIQINGKCICETGTKGSHHSIIDMLVHASKSEQLHPGEVFGTGTLPGGCAMENGHWLKPGDSIELTIEKIGSLVNTISKGSCKSQKNGSQEGL